MASSSSGTAPDQHTIHAGWYNKSNIDHYRGFIDAQK
jgi:hypothetical protein